MNSWWVVSAEFQIKYFLNLNCKNANQRFRLLCQDAKPLIIGILCVPNDTEVCINSFRVSCFCYKITKAQDCIIFVLFTAIVHDYYILCYV